MFSRREQINITVLEVREIFKQPCVKMEKCGLCGSTVSFNGYLISENMLKMLI